MTTQVEISMNDDWGQTKTIEIEDVVRELFIETFAGDLDRYFIKKDIGRVMKVVVGRFKKGKYDVATTNTILGYLLSIAHILEEEKYSSFKFINTLT